MINHAYAKAYKEVMEIIKYFPQEEFDKIPKEKVEFYKNNMDKNYVFTINPKIDLSNQNISKYYSKIKKKKSRIKEKNTIQIIYLNR